MKTKLYTIVLITVLIISCIGCGTTYQEAQEQAQTQTAIANKDYYGGYFTEIVSWSDIDGMYQIVYANDTKIKYFIVKDAYQFGITPLYNTDGTLQVYEE